MRTLRTLAFVLFFSLSSFTIQAAQDPSEVTTSFDGLSVSSEVEDIGKTVSEVSHYVGLVADAVKALDLMDRYGGRAISKSVATQIHEKLTLAIELMATIIEDPKLTEDQKARFTFDLASSIGEVVLTVVRHQGEDDLNPPQDMKTIEKLAAALREVVLDLKAVAPRRSALFGQADPEMSRWQKFWYGVAESPLGFEERVRRDRQAQAAFQKLEEFGRESLPQLGEDSPLRKAHRDFWTKEIVDRTLKIRGARLNAQKIVTGLYYGLAAYTLLAPPVDLVGLLGGRTDNSLFASSVLYFSFWVMIGTTKIRTLPRRTIQLAKDLADVLNSPLSEILGPEKGNFLQRLLRVGKGRQIRTCSEFLQET